MVLLLDQGLIIDIKLVGGGLLDYIVSSSPSSFPLDFGFCNWDLDLGLDLGLTIN